MDMSSSGELFAILGRICSNIQSEDRKKRKQALEELNIEVFKNPAEKSINFDDVFNEVQKHLWKSLYDQSEAVRDSCISLLSEFVNCVVPNKKYLEKLIPILLWRLGDKDIVEPSEEIRLKLISLLNLVIMKNSDCAPFTEDIVKILSKTLLDNYPKVRQESCICASNLACTVPSNFYNHSNKLIKPILASFNHQHSKMRVAAIQALGNVIQYGSTKNLPSQEVFGSLAERLFDSSPVVRSAVTKVIGDWLVNLHDRYSFFPKMVPLILTSLCDELLELREEAWKFWSDAGLQYENENEQELKEKMDFLNEKPDHYPSNIIRPNLGCRALVQRSTCQITSALSRELEDWKNDIRIKSAQLLCWLVLHAETDITQHTENLLLTMYKVCNQNDTRVVENVEKAAEYIAYFVSPDVYMKLIIPVVQDICTPGHLCVLAALIRGTKPESLLPHLVTLGEFLSSDNICRVRKNDYQCQLLKCCDALITIAKNNCVSIGYDIFLVLITVKALSQKPLTEYSNGLMEELCKVHDMEGVEDLYKKYTKLLIKKINCVDEIWTSVSYDRFILQIILEESGPIIGMYINDIYQLLKKNMTAEGDPIVKSKLFILMSSILYRRHVTMSLVNETVYCKFIVSFIQDIISPNLVWHAGKTAEALRTMVVACLCAALLPRKESAVLFDEHIEVSSDESDEKFYDNKCLSIETSDEIFKILFPLLLNNIEDNSYKTRLFSLKALQNLITMASKREILTCDHVNQSYPLILKRLDDVSMDVRNVAVQLLITMYDNLPLSYEPTAFEPHLRSLFGTLLIHLDDPEPEFQNLMADALKSIGKVNPKVLSEKLNEDKHKFKNFKMCKDILHYLKQYLKTDCD